MIRHTFPALLALLLSLPAHAQQAPAGGEVSAHQLCLDPTSRLERQYGIDAGLLSAIGRTESGRRDPESGVWAPWPWTINAEGTPHYFQSKADAVRAVQGMLVQGMTNIDIGCMQISLHWHNEKFTTLDDIFDPVNNITYAAEYLAALKDQYGTWEAATGYYHSSDRDRRSAYLRRVLGYWQRGSMADAAIVTGGDGTGPLARAASAFEAGKLSDALVLYNDVLEVDPDDRTARHGRARTLDALGREDAALDAWRDLLALSPGHGAALDRLAGHVRALPPDAALDAAQGLWRLAPDQPAVLSLLGETHARVGNGDDALAMHLAAHGAAPRAPLPVLNTAVTLDRAGRGPEALLYYARFLDLYRADPVPLTVSLDAIRDRMVFLRRKSSG